MAESYEEEAVSRTISLSDEPENWTSMGGTQPAAFPASLAFPWSYSRGVADTSLTRHLRVMPLMRG